MGNQSAVDNTVIPHAIEVNKSNDNTIVSSPKQLKNVVTVVDNHDHPVATKPADTIPAFTPWIIGATDLVSPDQQQINQDNNDNPISKGTSSSLGPRTLTNRKSEGFIPTHTDDLLPTTIDDSALSHS